MIVHQMYFVETIKATLMKIGKVKYKNQLYTGWTTYLRQLHPGWTICVKIWRVVWRHPLTMVTSTLCYYGGYVKGWIEYNLQKDGFVQHYALGINRTLNMCLFRLLTLSFSERSSLLAFARCEVCASYGPKVNVKVIVDSRKINRQD